MCTLGVPLKKAVVDDSDPYLSKIGGAPVWMRNMCRISTRNVRSGFSHFVRHIKSTVWLLWIPVVSYLSDIRANGAGWWSHLHYLLISLSIIDLFISSLVYQSVARHPPGGTYFAIKLLLCLLFPRLLKIPKPAKCPKLRRVGMTTKWIWMI